MSSDDDFVQIAYQVRRFAPLTADHPGVVNGEACPGCDRVFEAGDVVCLVFVGPGDDPEAREKARMGRAYNAVALPAHWACVTGEETP